MKQILYDWNGWNTELFHLINNIHGVLYDKLMLLGTLLGERSNFPIYLVIFGLFFLLARERHRSSVLYPAIRAVWLNVIAVFMLAFFADWAFLHLAKHYFSYPRPFVALPPGSFRTIGNPMPPTQYYVSFPSGHASFAMLLAASLWPALNQLGKLFAAIFVIWVCWSRLALGVHFPADLLAGAVSCLLIILIVRWAVNRVDFISSEKIKR